MRLAILYVCTGKYNQFFEGFYESSERNLLKDMEKTYFVWTDDETLAANGKNVKVYHKECAGFPADSLFKFEMFLQAEQDLKEYDYVYFFNANTEIRLPIGMDFLPDETGLVAARWPVVEKRNVLFFPYERNKKSLAYIPPFKPPYNYYMGGLNGGRTKEYLSMARILAINIRKDYDNGIIARFHDESHINAYLRENPCKILDTSYNMPEEWSDENSKIIFREKTHIDPYFTKNMSSSSMAKCIRGLKMFVSGLRWCLYV